MHVILPRHFTFHKLARAKVVTKVDLGPEIFCMIMLFYVSPVAKKGLNISYF